MADYTVDQIKEAIRNADKAGDSAAVLALGKRLAAMHQQSQPQPTLKAQQPWYQSALSGFERGVKPVADFVSAIDPIKYATNAVTDYFAPGMRQREENALAAQAQQAQRQNPISYGGGKLAGNIVATLPVGPVLGTVARGVAGGTRIGEAVATGLSSGGLKTGLTATRAAVKAGAAAPTLGARAVDLAIRAGTGATTGAVSAGLTGDDAIAGSLIGALVPTAGAAVGRVALDKVILPAYERLSGQLGKVRAAAILQKAFNMPIDAVIALARNAPEGVPFAKVVAQAGIEKPAFQALAAKMAEGPGKHIYGPIARAETQAQQDTLNAMARGGTEREARNALATGRKAIGADYAAAEQKVFERANLGGKTIPPLNAQAVAAEQAATGQSGLARRMVLGMDRTETKLGQMDDLGDQFNPAAINAARGQAGAMGQRAETAAQEAIRLRGEADAARQQIADLNTQGIHALETRPVASSIRGLKQAEGLSSTQRAALESIAQEIESHGPIIRAGDLDAIRKDANVTVAKLLGPNVDVGGVKTATAELVGRIKPFIDNAIEGAGGAGYKEAKAGFAAGVTDLERQQFAGKLAGVFEQDPEKFARTVRGAYGTTGAVQEAFPRAGGRNFDIQEMMGVPGGAAGPSRMPALENIAGGVELNSRMAAQAGEGKHLASDLLKNPPQEADIFHKYSPVGMVGSAAGALLKFTKILSESGLDRQTQQALAEGFRNGKTAEELLTTIPLADRMQLKQRMASYGLFAPRNIINAMGRNSTNALYGAATAVPSSQNLVGIGTGPSGESYPMYGEPSQNQNAMAGY